MHTPTLVQDRINKHITTLHRIHKARHKRYRTSPLADAVEELIELNQAEQEKHAQTQEQQDAQNQAGYLLIFLTGFSLPLTAWVCSVTIF